MALMDDGDEGRFASNAVLRPEEEIGLGAVSSSLFANVTSYHAQIGAGVDREVLQQLEWNLLGEAKALFTSYAPQRPRRARSLRTGPRGRRVRPPALSNGAARRWPLPGARRRWRRVRSAYVRAFQARDVVGRA